MNVLAMHRPMTLAVLMVAATAFHLWAEDENGRLTVTHKEPEFELQLPEHFRALPEIEPTNGMLYRFVWSDDDEATPDVFLSILELPRPLPKNPAQPEGIAMGYSTSNRRWRGFDVPGIRFTEVIDGVRAVAFKVNIPLKPRAIQLQILGNALTETATSDLLDEVLDGLRGDTTWVEAPPENSYSASDDRWMYIGAIGMIVVLALVLVGLCLVFRHAKRGMALGFAVLLFVIAVALPSEQSRLLMVTDGAMRCLAIGLACYGVYDLFRRRP